MTDCNQARVMDLLADNRQCLDQLSNPSSVSSLSGRILPDGKSRRKWPSNQEAAQSVILGCMKRKAAVGLSYM